MNVQEQIKLQIDIEDVKQILSERDFQILQLKSVIRNLAKEIESLKAENDMLKKDIEKLQKKNKFKPVK